MKKVSKIISCILVGSFIISNAVSFVFATRNDISLHTKSECFLDLKTTQFNHVKNTSTVAFADMTPVMEGVGTLSAGLYLIPGVGEVLITVTGAIVVAGVTVEVGSFFV